MNYFPSRFDPARHAEKVPVPTRVLTGCREKVCIVLCLNSNSTFMLQYCYGGLVATSLYYIMAKVYCWNFFLDSENVACAVEICSASSRRRTTSSRLVRDIDPSTLQGLLPHLRLFGLQA